MRISKIAILLIPALVGVLLFLMGYFAGHISGREEGYQVGRNSLIRYIDTAEKHIEERIDDVVEGRPASKHWREKVVSQCGERRRLITKGVKGK